MLVNDAVTSLRPLLGTPSVASISSTCSTGPRSDGVGNTRSSGHNQFPSHNDLSLHMQHSGTSAFTSSSPIRHLSSGHMHTNQQLSDQGSADKCDVKDSDNCGVENANNQQHSQQVGWMKLDLMCFPSSKLSYPRRYMRTRDRVCKWRTSVYIDLYRIHLKLCAPIDTRYCLF